MDIVSINLVMWPFLVWYWMNGYWIDIPNLQTVKLPNSFRYVKSKSINSVIVNSNSCIDVSPILADLVQLQYQDSISTIQTVNRHINNASTNIMDSRLTNHEYMKYNNHGNHMIWKYRNHQMRHGYRKGFYLNSKLHKNGMNSKLYNRHTVVQFHKLRID